MFRKKILLADEIAIGPNEPVVVVAEAGVLTFGEKKTGFRFVDEAKRIGVKLLKFQCVNPENVVSRFDQYWLERLKQRSLKEEDFLEIMKYGKKNGVICFASTHNEYDLVRLAERGMPILKIGSGDSNNFRMIDMALETKLPVILSLGLLKLAQIYQVLTRYRYFAGQLILMHCTTAYPAEPRLANLDLIIKMQSDFREYNLGYSDHVAGYNVALAAAGMPEVRIIEKHFCLPEHKVKPKYDSLDIPVALVSDEFKKFMIGVKEIFAATREFKEDPEIFKAKKWAQKAICARRDIPAGKKIFSEDLMSIRPFAEEKGHIPIDKFYNIIGQQAKPKQKIKKGDYLLSKNFVF